MPVTLSRRQFLGTAALFLGTSCLKQAWSASSHPPLPIPPLADGRDGSLLDLQIQSGEWSFMPGVRTPTLGINQSYLGPTLRTRQHSTLNLNYHNRLDEGVAIHGHGLHVPGSLDGGPQLEMAPDAQWQPALPIVQPAATCWYHSHTHGRTGYQTYHGLAGMIIIDDALSDSLELPDQYGIDDLPVIIQDRTFDARGRLVYSLEDAGEDGWLGETVVINGAISPLARVPAGKIRLRLLNGSNARFYIVTFADNRTFHKIASDGGLLTAPVPLTSMEMSPGERCEIVVDLSDGQTARLLTLFEDLLDAEGEGIIDDILSVMGQSEFSQQEAALTLEVDQSLRANRAPLPEKMATIVRPEESEIKRTRSFVLTMDHADSHAGHKGHAAMDMGINGQAMDMNVINERVKRGEWERWRIRADQGAHPFHIHGCSFLIEQMEGETVPLSQSGWKDTVVLDDDDWSSVLVRFDHRATAEFPYMYHCHILEHEDRGMMGQFTVT
ncbi:multicopper oxidase domain-containing protein [Kiloniella sp. b19]|uniref:multicopper oxidase domain-containing protein n=1 Tax=Kiloniella sp. GXU_MW_B19 TaxID=3141326 RepID=UPI0031DB948B